MSRQIGLKPLILLGFLHVLSLHITGIQDVLLQILHAYDLKEYWLREYDAAVKNGIIPREMLSEKYNYLRQNDKFPEDSDYLYN